MYLGCHCTQVPRQVTFWDVEEKTEANKDFLSLRWGSLKMGLAVELYSKPLRSEVWACSRTEEGALV